MAELRPFRGLRYGPQHAADLGAQLAPPFDVINPTQQKELYDLSPHNVVRLELGEITSDDTDSNNRYTRAASQLRQWVSEKVLVREDAPAFYVVQHRFVHEGVERVRWEILAQVKLTNWDEKVVLPHEFTLSAPKSDRMSLLKATRTNISPVFSLYHDPDGELAGIIQESTMQQPIEEVGEWGIAGFTVWAIKDPAVVSRIQSFFAPRQLYIADGHHRYETALNYRNERQAEGGAKGDEGFNYVFMSLTRVEDPGLLILPIHRLLRNLPFLSTSNVRIEFDIRWILQDHPMEDTTKEIYAVLDILKARGEKGPTLGVYGLEPAAADTVTPRNVEALRNKYLPNVHPTIRDLDVSLLHGVIIHGYLGMNRDPEITEAAIKFTHDVQEVIEAIDNREYMLAFFMNPTKVEQIVAVAEAGEKMPQKSTFFYPKLPTGLLMNPLDDA